MLGHAKMSEIRFLKKLILIHYLYANLNTIVEERTGKINKKSVICLANVNERIDSKVEHATRAKFLMEMFVMYF